jgi:hypothetical protein
MAKIIFSKDEVNILVFSGKVGNAEIEGGKITCEEIASILEERVRNEEENYEETKVFSVAGGEWEVIVRKKG